MIENTVSQGFRLSPQQQHVWWAQRGGSAPAFVVQARIDIEGALDRQRLTKALESAAERHEILRTTFPLLPGLSVPVQAIESSPRVDWSERSLAEVSGEELESALDRLCGELREVPFDLVGGPLLRAVLIEFAGERHALILSQPALAADGLSLDLLAAEIAAAYHGTLAEGEVLQYADLAEILHEWQGSPAEEPGPTFWREQDFSPLTRVTLGEAGLPDGRPFRPARTCHRIEREPVEAATARFGTTVSTILLAGWQAALHVATGEEEIVVGTLFNGRTCEELESALGPFARYLPVRCRSASGSTLEELVRSLSATVAEVSRRQDFFSSASVERLLAHQEASGWPFGFDHRRPRPLPAPAGGPTFAVRDGFLGLDRFGLRLSVLDDGRSLRADLAHDPALFSREAAERLLERFSRVLEGLLAGAALGEIDGLTGSERQQVLLDFNRTARPIPGNLRAHDLFEEQARLAPNAPAVIFEGRAWSYAELDDRSNRLARELRDAGLEPGSLVGVCLERSPDLVEAVLGILKAGAAYVPLDPGYPADRLSWMAKDARLSLLLTQESLRPLFAGTFAGTLRLVADRSEGSRPGGGALPRCACPDDLAYVIYTSGSTGRPKGVMVPHRGLVNYLLWARQAYRASEGAGAPVHSAIGFDLTVTSLLVPLAAGTPVTLLDERRSVEALVTALRESQGFSLVKLTPAHLEVLRRELSPDQYAGRARALVIGGEALRGESLAPWVEHAPGTRLINEYGPTEATVGCCVYEAIGEVPSGLVPIGRPIANTRLYVVGPKLRAVPPGAPGELLIGGDGLARGYLRQPALTAERFVPDPFAGDARPGGERLYRTGDLVRLRPDGQLEFLGRTDDQLKIRGFRIEPGEIEAALAGHPKVREAVVVAREDAGGRRLVAYVVPRSRDDRPGASELRGHLEERLPDYMIPSASVVLDSLPLTPNGKVDRRALPDPGQAGEEAPYAPPRTLAEEVLVEIWGQALGVDRVGIDDNFFSLGGDSIRSLQILALAQKRGIVLTLQDLFRHPTIRKLADSVRLDGIAGELEAGPAPFDLVSVDRERLDPGLEDAYPLTHLQAGMLFHSEMSPESAIYHDLHSFRLRGRYDFELLAIALRQVAQRHPVLRTSFDLTSCEEPLQLVHPRAEIPFEVDDLRHLSLEEGRRIALAWLEEEPFRPFDWSRAPLARFQIHLFGDGSFQFTLSFHHSILDGWSAASLLTELFRRYLALLDDPSCPQEAPPSATLREFVQLERSVLASAEARSFWQKHLEGSPLVRLPRRRAEGGSADRRADRVDVTLPLELSDGLKQVARSLSLPLKSVLMAVHFRVLGLLSGLTDVVSGVVSNGRPERSDGEQAIGLFLNTLPLRLGLSGGSWGALAQSVFELERGSLPFRRLPLAELQQMEGGRTLFEVTFNFIHYHVYDSLAQLSGLEVLSREGYEETNFSLITHFQLSGSNSRIHLTLSYQAAEYDRDEIEAMARRYLAAAERMAADPRAPYETWPLFTKAERAQLLDLNRTARPMRLPLLVHEIFEAQVERTPEAPAAEMGSGRLTYRELDERAERLARWLRAAGVRPDHPVGMCLERSLAVPVAVLGILKAGGAYLPLDPAYPAERLEAMAEDARLRWTVCDRTTAGRLPVGSPGERGVLILGPAGELDGEIDGKAAEPPAPVAPDNLAYVLYTSGSTGRPKGVAMPHGPLANLIDWQIAVTTAPGPRRTAQFSALSFDASFHEMFTSWGQGGTLVLLSEEVRRDSGALLNLLADRSIEQLFLPFVALQQLADEAAAGRVLPAALREVITAGEQLQATAAVRELFRRVAQSRLVNAYGPTETHVVTAFTLPESPDAWPTLPSIGPPIANTTVRVLDASLQPVLPGAQGELYFGGSCLARGYIGRPDLTAERFLPDPQATEPGARVYRTGDLGRCQPDGGIEFLGRTDHQVKVRGFRVEPGEIEAALALHPEVREAAVVVREVSGPGDRRLVGYVVPRGRAETGEAFAGELRAFLADRLPEYMVPWTIVLLDEFPLTSSGKLDRRQLPAPVAVRRLGADLAPPRGPIEDSLAGFWSEVLGCGPVGIHESFFDLGGHSLLATRVITRVRAAFGIELPLRALFENPTVAGLAAAVERVLRTGAVPLPPLVPLPREGDPPLSFAQQRLWFLDQILPGDLAYSLPFIIRVFGRLDVNALAKSFGLVVARHEILRTTFLVRDGEPVQKIAPPPTVAVPVGDLSALPPNRIETELRRFLRTEIRRPFSLVDGPLLRIRLVRLGDEEHALLLNLHHIVADGWSTGVLVRELTAAYAAFLRGALPSLPELPIQYTDYAVWQRSWLQGEALEEQLAWWRQELADSPAALDLTFDRPRPAVASHRGGQVATALSAELTAVLKGLSRRHGATLFMTLLAGWSALLSRHADQEDVLVGSPIANRARVEIEGLIGFFVNTLVLRSDLSGSPSFGELVERVRRATLGAYDHQDLPFERLVEELSPERSLRHSPIFQVMIELQHPPVGTIEAAGLELRPLRFEGGTAKFDLSLSFVEASSGLHGALSYNSDLFDQTTAERLLDHFCRLLRMAAADPASRLSDLPILSAAEREQLVAGAEACRRATPEIAAGFPELFAWMAARKPTAVAVAGAGEELTFGELRQWSDRLAASLRREGVGLEKRVAVCGEPSAGLVAGVLAVLQVGGVWVPLDPAHPDERLAGMLEDSRASILLVQEKFRQRLEGFGVPILPVDGEKRASGDLRPASGDPEPIPLEAAAYVIYTSGTTGRPKGTVVSHRNLVGYLTWFNQSFARSASFPIPWISSPGFDASLKQFLAPLLRGEAVWTFPPGMASRPDDLLAEIATRSGAALNCVPSLWRVVLDKIESESVDRAPRHLLLGGEALAPSLVERTVAALPGIQIWNLYGPTEATANASCARIDSGKVSIGQGVAGAALYVIDRKMNLVPPGVPGELMIAGNGLARGYLGVPALTAERFVPNPFATEPGERLYRTGDRACLLPDGRIELVGRVDRQVKIRGFRLEPGEVEAALCRHHSVAEAVVAPWGGAPDDLRLAAWIVPAANAAPDATELRDHLRSLLPEPMVPSAWTVLSALPLSPNGKVNRAALPPPDRPASSVAPYQEPRTTSEIEIAKIWCEVLNLPKVGIEENFFDLGGHSLLMVRLQAQLSRQFSRQINIIDLFSHPTVGSFAQFLTNAEESKASKVRTTEQERRMAGGKERLRRLRQAASDDRRAR